MTYMEQLKNKLNEMGAKGVRLSSVYLGDLEGATPEDVAKELLQMQVAIEAGKTKPLRFNDSQRRVE